MYANTSPFDASPDVDVAKHHQRVAAAAAVSFKHDAGSTRLDRLYQQGSAKIRFPKPYTNVLEAVLINTAGGLTGGDRLSWDMELKSGCSVVATTQACEKSYRSSSGTAHVQTSIQVAKDSTLHWLPQETILYEGSSLSRDFSVELEPNAEFLALECVVLGREAMGEALEQASFHDRWRISRDGRLVFADDLRVGSVNNGIAGFRDNRALASLLFVTAKDDELLQTQVQHLRTLCPASLAGFSGFDGKITGRILARDSYELRQALVPVLTFLRGTGLPRVWRI